MTFFSESNRFSDQLPFYSRQGQQIRPKIIWGLAGTAMLVFCVSFFKTGHLEIRKFIGFQALDFPAIYSVREKAERGRSRAFGT